MHTPSPQLARSIAELKQDHSRTLITLAYIAALGRPPTQVELLTYPIFSGGEEIRKTLIRIKKSQGVSDSQTERHHAKKCELEQSTRYNKLESFLQRDPELCALLKTLIGVIN